VAPRGTERWRSLPRLLIQRFLLTSMVLVGDVEVGLQHGRHELQGKQRGRGEISCPWLFRELRRWVHLAHGLGTLCSRKNDPPPVHLIRTVLGFPTMLPGRTQVGPWRYRPPPRWRRAPAPTGGRLPPPVTPRSVGAGAAGVSGCPGGGGPPTRRPNRLPGPASGACPSTTGTVRTSSAR
jgi:hypothetical protein